MDNILNLLFFKNEFKNYNSSYKKLLYFDN